MPYYKDKSEALYCIDDAAFEYLLPPSCTKIADTEFFALINRPPTPEEIKAAVRRQIDDLERNYMMPRATREALLAYAVAIAASSGITEAQLCAGNIAYRKVKDFDSQIAALRAQL